MEAAEDAARLVGAALDPGTARAARLDEAVLARLLYKNNFQHRKCTYYRRMREVRRLHSAVRLDELAGDAAAAAQAGTAALVELLVARGSALRRALGATVKCGGELRALVRTGFFASFAISSFALVSRLFVIDLAALNAVAKAYRAVAADCDDSGESVWIMRVSSASGVWWAEDDDGGGGGAAATATEEMAAVAAKVEPPAAEEQLPAASMLDSDGDDDASAPSAAPAPKPQAESTFALLAAPPHERGRKRGADGSGPKKAKKRKKKGKRSAIDDIFGGL